MSQINASSFGRYADDVVECMGEYTLPVGDDHEIHPAAGGRGWAVVATRTGAVLGEYSRVEDAVAHAESCE